MDNNKIANELLKVAESLIAGRGFTKQRTEPLPDVNGVWRKVWFNYHPDGTMEIQLSSTAKIEFGFSTYVDRDWGIWDTNQLDDLYKNIRNGKMPRGFVHTEGAKFIPEQ
jgi:hypothetical protein